MQHFIDIYLIRICFKIQKLLEVTIRDVFLKQITTSTRVLTMRTSELQSVVRFACVSRQACLIFIALGAQATPVQGVLLDPSDVLLFDEHMQRFFFKLELLLDDDTWKDI